MLVNRSLIERPGHVVLHQNVDDLALLVDQRDAGDAIIKHLRDGHLYRIHDGGLNFLYFDSL